MKLSGGMCKSIPPFCEKVFLSKKVTHFCVSYSKVVRTPNGNDYGKDLLKEPLELHHNGVKH
jgi:hypothetical protein